MNSSPGCLPWWHLVSWSAISKPGIWRWCSTVYRTTDLIQMSSVFWHLRVCACLALCGSVPCIALCNHHYSLVSEQITPRELHRLYSLFNSLILSMWPFPFSFVFVFVFFSLLAVLGLCYCRGGSTPGPEQVVVSFGRSDQPLPKSPELRAGDVTKGQICRFLERARREMGRKLIAVCPQKNQMCMDAGTAELIPTGNKHEHLVKKAPLSV